VITGGMGLVWVALWLCFTNPESDVSLRLSEYIKAGQTTFAKRWPASFNTQIPGKEILGIPTAHARGSDMGTLTFWLPLYLKTVRGFDLKQIDVCVAAVSAADLGFVWPGSNVRAGRFAGFKLLNARRRSPSLA
jgi:ACS family hexuronate transporter-like MFS transporter